MLIVITRLAIGMMFQTTSREKAKAQAEKYLARYMALAENLDEASGRKCVEVPLMRGVDEDMRNWSFYMLLEHNVIVNDTISAITCQLARGEELSGKAIIDPKHDVMPGPDPGPEQVLLFRDSVMAHHAAVAELGSLKGTKTAPHPIFGDFSAHQWNCMFSFHLGLHLSQARAIVAGVTR